MRPNALNQTEHQIFFYPNRDSGLLQHYSQNPLSLRQNNQILSWITKKE